MEDLDLDITRVVSEPRAMETVKAVIDGTMAPSEGATRLMGLWAPVEDLNPVGNEGWFLRSRSDSLCALNETAIEWGNRGHGLPARRLAELTWVLADQIGIEGLRVETALALAQLMAGDIASGRRRLQLLEFAVPAALRRGQPSDVELLLLCHLADARFNEAHDRETFEAVIEPCQAALEMDGSIDDLWRRRLHYVAGIAYQRLGGRDDNYRSSIDHLTKSLRHYDAERHLEQRAGILRSLGDAYRELALRARDPALLKTALDCYDEVVSLGCDEQLRRRAAASSAEAEALFENLADQPVPGSPSALGEVRSTLRVLFGAGDQALSVYHAGGDGAVEHRERAVEKYLAAAKLLDRQTPPGMRAELHHRLATLFLTEPEDDAMWTGVCFASATQRLGTTWRPISLARVSFHLGWMLMRIATTDPTVLLRYQQEARRLLEEALPLLRTDGQPQEAEHAEGLRQACLTVLGFHDDEEAEEAARRGAAEKELRRLDEELKSPAADELRGAYLDYLRIVIQGARHELAARLAADERRHWQILASDTLDEYNQALELLTLAAHARAVGDLVRALDFAAVAERIAEQARYSAPSVWCRLARFHGTLPMKDRALHCVHKAQQLMEQVARPGEAVLPGHSDGRWIPEYPLDTYQAEIDTTSAEMENLATEPAWEADVTASLLRPDDVEGCDELRRKLDNHLRHDNSI